MQGIRGFFRNYYFSMKFLINLPKIQEIHFFLQLIYIIIGEEIALSETFSETNSGGNEPGNSLGGCQDRKTVPGTVSKIPENQNEPPRRRAERIKGESTWSIRYG